MPAHLPGAVPDDHPDARLAQTLAALATPSRIALMRALRAPRILAEIEVKSPDAPGRNLARQTVRQHLDVLIDAAMVSARETERSRGETQEFVVNHQAVYALAEDLRGLARLRPLVEQRHETAPLEDAHERPLRRPCLVLVKGLDEGTSFSLRPEEPHLVEWIVGRRRGAEVALDFDPFVSSENSRIAWREGAHHVEDLPGSRNGTWVNFRPLEPGRRHRLQQGDVLGVGRSYLVYWA